MFWTHAASSAGSTRVARGANRPRRPAAQSRAFRRSRFEPLENRMMLSYGIVTTSAGSGTWAEGCASYLAGDKIVVAGKVFPPMGWLQPVEDIVDYWSSIEDIVLARYDSNGGLDPTFSGGLVTVPISGGECARAVAPYGEGQFVVAGYGSRPRETAPNFLVARFNDTGTLDAEFRGSRKDTPGTAQTDLGTRESLNAALVQADGKIVAAGSGFHLARYTTTGSLDTGFGSSGIVEPPADGFAWDHPRAMAFLPGDRIVVVGDTYDVGTGRTDIALACYHLTSGAGFQAGDLDASFAGDGTVVMTGVEGNHVANAVAVDASNRIIVAGNEFVARFNSDGTPDLAFSTTGIVGDAPVDAYSLAIQPGNVDNPDDDMIIVAGRRNDQLALARYNSGGVLDGGFGNGGLVVTPIGESGGVRSVLLQGDKIVAAGWASITSGRVLALARYTNDGQLDPTFGPDPPSASINSVSMSEGNSGVKQFDFQVTLSSAKALPVTVDYSVSDGTATAGSDYESPVSGQLVFLPGAVSKTVTVLVQGDTAKEQNETFYVTLAGAEGAVIAGSPGVGTILNDDGKPPKSVPVALSATDLYFFELSLNKAREPDSLATRVTD